MIFLAAVVYKTVKTYHYVSKPVVTKKVYYHTTVSTITLTFWIPKGIEPVSSSLSLSVLISNILRVETFGEVKAKGFDTGGDLKIQRFKIYY